MTVLVTGAAGFIGCNLCRVLAAQGQRVLGLDNFRRGRREFLSTTAATGLLRFEQVDLTDLARYSDAVKSCHLSDPITEVWHMAANSDIAAGVADANVDLRDTFLTTFNTLEVMRDVGIGTLAFASSSAIYGNLGTTALVEEVGPLLPISNYGAMKLASEAAISAAAESFLQHAFIFRFPNVVGLPATHGVILDFVRKLKATPGRLEVLGDGTQQKSYLHVEELLDAMFFIRGNARARVNVFNIGPEDDGVSVRDIAEQVVQVVSPSASIVYGRGNRGWVGDVPRFRYSTAKLRALGWRAEMRSASAVGRAIAEIARQEAAE